MNRYLLPCHLPSMAIGVIERRGADLRQKARPQHFGNEFLARGDDGHFLRLRRFVSGPSADIDPTAPRQSPTPENADSVGSIPPPPPAAISGHPLTGRL